MELTTYFKNRLPLKDQVAFTKRLAFLVRADVPILESLRMMHKQTRSKSRAEIIDHIIQDVSNGQYLADSLAKFRNTFGDFAINIIRVGEEGGILDQNLEYLAEELYKRQELKKKIIGALIYPAFITISTLGVSGFVTAYVFPKIMPIFKSMGTTLPVTTRALIFVSGFIIHYGILTLFGLVIAGFICFMAYKKNKAFNYAASHAMMKMPVWGNLIQNYYMANFARTLGLLLNCQMNIITAARITADSTPNLIYKHRIYELADEISRGRKISQYLETQANLFPEMVPQMIAIGETTGSLGNTLIYLSDYYEKEVNEITKNLSSSIEPILLVCVGVIVGFIAVSVITPIYQLTQNIHP